MLAAAAPAEPAPGLTTALLRDPDVASCARDAGESGAAYAARAFTFGALTLRSGARVTIAEGADACLARGQSTRYEIFVRLPGGAYRRVLDGVVIPGLASAGTDGVVVLPTHDTASTIFEGAYVWNGKEFAFSPQLTRIYDVATETRKPYRIVVRFEPGSSSATLTGRVSAVFDDRYTFDARAGQRVTLAIVPSKEKLDVSLWLGEKSVAFLSSGSWTGVLPKLGTYELLVSASGRNADPSALVRYAIVLTFR